MHKFIQMFGVVIAAIGILVAGLAAGDHSGLGNGGLMGILIGASIALPGAMLYCFGAIVEHLIVIRRNSEKQLAIFERLGQPKP